MPAKSKYDGIKNPDMTDEEFEAWEAATTLTMLRRQQQRADSDGLAPGLFMGYFGCPVCNYRHDLIRPETGDIEIVCECGTHWVIPLTQAARIIPRLEMSDAAEVG